MKRNYSELSLDESAILNDLKKHMDEAASSVNNKFINMSDTSITSTEFDLFKRKICLEDTKNSTIENPVIGNDVIMEEDPTEILMSEIKKKNEITNNDLFSIMCSIYNVGKKTSEDIKRIETNVQTLNTQVNANTKNIRLIHNNLIDQYHLIFKALEKTNHNAQADIDNDIFVPGITPEIAPVDVVKGICKFYKIPENCIASYKSFPTKNHDRSIKANNITIKFVNKADQIGLIQLKSTAGAPTLGYIKKQSPITDKTAIRIVRSLTPENRQIGYQLRLLQSTDKIHKSRYKNCFYEIMIKEGSDFISIPSLEHLKLHFGINT